MVGCDDSEGGGGDKTCTPECATWQTCDDGACKTAADKCASDNDCTEGTLTKCGGADSHTCIDPATFDCSSCDTTYQTCDEAGKKCDLKAGMCISSTDCTDGTKTECDTASHMCKEPVSTDCTDGETKCDGNGIATCTDNKWSVVACNGDKTCKLEGDTPTCVEKAALMPIATVKAMTEAGDVSVQGVVTYVSMYNETVGGIYLQDSTDAHSAIYVYINGGIASAVKAGDTVTVMGNANVRYGVVQIGTDEAIPSVVIDDDTTSVPTAKMVATTELDADVVDMLVEVSGAPFTVVTLGNEDNFYNTTIKDSSDNEFVIKSSFFRFTDNGLTEGGTITKLVGLVSSYQDGETFTYSVKPRTAADMTFEGGSVEGTEGNACRTEDPKCDTGLECSDANVCEKVVVDPCAGACTETQYCDTTVDPATCVELTKKSIADVKAMTESGNVWVEGTVTYVNMYNNMVGKVYLQESSDDHSAIFVYFEGGVDSAVKAGDTVKVIGLANERFGVIQIGTNSAVPSITVVTEGDVVPDPKAVTITGLDAPVVDMLIEVSGTPFTVTEISGKNVVLKNDSDEELTIRTDFYNAMEDGLVVGSEVTKVVGLVSSWFENEVFTYSVKVRSADDIMFTAPDMSGKEGYECRDADPKCDEGLQCNADTICEIIPPCNGECTELQYCDQSGDTDVCVDKYTVKTIAEARALEVDMAVKVSGTVTGLTHPYEMNDETEAYEMNMDKVRGLFIQDGDDALYIYLGSNVVIAELDAALAVGKTVDVLGYTGAYKGNAQIVGMNQDDVMVTVTGDADAPEALAVVTVDETVESELVTITGTFTVTVIGDADNSYVTTLTDGDRTVYVETDVFRFDTVVDEVYTSFTGFAKETMLGDVSVFTVLPRKVEDIVKSM